MCTLWTLDFLIYRNKKIYKMTSHAIPAFPNPVPYAVLPSNSPALLAPHNPLTHSAIQTAISPGALRNCIR